MITFRKIKNFIRYTLLMYKLKQLVKEIYPGSSVFRSNIVYSVGVDLIVLSKVINKDIIVGNWLEMVATRCDKFKIPFRVVNNV